MKISPPTPLQGIRAAVLVSAITAGGVYLALKKQRDTAAASRQAQVNSLGRTVASPTSSASPASTTFRNQYLTVSVPSGWSAVQVAGSLASVNITKDGYVLYINAKAYQASGVNGGRFAEIAQGAPSADAVIKSWPSSPCSAPVLSDLANSGLFSRRADLYVGSGASSNCNTPSASAVWYFSYLTGASGSYFNYYVTGQNPALVVTMSYQANAIDALPKKGDAGLARALTEMTDIAGSLRVTE